MNLSEFAWQHRPVVLLILFVAMLQGVLSWFELPAREDPSITIREAIVTTRFPGLPAEQVERLITVPLEEELLTVEGIEEARSTSTDGRSIIYTRAYDHLDELDQVWDEVEETVAAARPSLPAGARPPKVNDDFGDVAVATLALTGEDYALSDLHDFAEHARSALVRVPGTKKVEIIGSLEERIYVETDRALLAGSGITLGAIADALRAHNVLQPAGAVDTGEREFALVTAGEFATLDDVRNLLVPVPADGSLVALGDIASVRRAYADPPPRRAFFNGEEAVVLSVAMQDGQRVLHFAERVAQAVDDLRAELPAGLTLDVITWQADQVENAVYGVSLNVLQTLAIVLAVVVLFLGVRTGLIVGSIVPAVMLTTLAFMGVFGISLERMSLATLVIALGLLVDNGVVIAEDFKRRLGEHGDRDQALRETGRELALPLLASSATTVLVFLPLMLAQHSAGEYTRNISLVILITLSSSWLIAMTVTPTLCRLFLKAPGGTANDAASEASDGAARSSRGAGADTGHGVCGGGVSGSTHGDAARRERGDDGLFRRIEAAYARALRFVLRHRVAFLVLMFLTLPLGGLLVRSAPNQFFPDSDRAQVLVYVNLPAGVTTRTTEARMREMMTLIGDEARYPELQDFAAYVGFGGPRFVLSLAPLDPAPNAGFMVINASDRAAVSAAIPRLRDDFRTQFPDVEARVSSMFLGPSDPNVIQIQVKGPDATYLVERAAEVEAMLEAIPGTIDVWSNWYNPVTRLELAFDQQLAQRAGVRREDVTRALATQFSGRRIANFRDGDEVFPIVARARASERADPADVDAAIIAVAEGVGVPAAQLGTVRPRAGFAHIAHEDLVRTVTVEARNLRMTPEDMAPLLADDIDAMNADMAPGHAVEFDGIVVDAAEGRAALFANFPLCLGLSVLLLVAQFNGYRRPLIVLLTIPLVVFGVGLGLTVMRADFGFLVILGLFSLGGIIVNNAIVLIDRIDIERRAGERSDLDAVISACARRLRPILMTTITTIVGLMPLIVARDVLFYGMASIMAFGLAIGTVLTLGVAPALYCLFFGIREASAGGAALTPATSAAAASGAPANATAS